MEQRRNMTAVRADYLDKLRDGADVIPMRSTTPKRRTTAATNEPQ